MSTERFDIEVTDTFGGEANYCWVTRDTIEFDMPENMPRAKERHRLVRAAKAFAGWTGLRCVVSDYGDTIDIRPRGICQVAFITWRDPRID